MIRKQDGQLLRAALVAFALALVGGGILFWCCGEPAPGAEQPAVGVAPVWRGPSPWATPTSSAGQFVSPVPTPAVQHTLYLPCLVNRGGGVGCYSRLKGCGNAPYGEWEFWGCGWAPRWQPYGFRRPGPDGQPDQIAIPMPIHGAEEQSIKDRRTVDPERTRIADLCAEVGFCLGHNEPGNFAAGGGMVTVDQVIADWPFLESVCRDGECKLLSPALTSNIDPTVWYRDFFARCPDCRIDGMAFHWYGQGFDDFVSLARLYQAIYMQRKMTGGLWLTEFACLKEHNLSEEQCDKVNLQIMNYCEKAGIHYSVYDVFPVDPRLACNHCRTWGATVDWCSGRLTPFGSQLRAFPCDWQSESDNEENDNENREVEQ